jgi:hypothetical protein
MTAWFAVANFTVPTLEFPVFPNSKISVPLGGLKKVEQKSIHYVFVQTKDAFVQESKIIVFFEIFGPANLRARGATLTVGLVVIKTNKI